MNNNFFNENQNPIIKICSEEKPSFFINQNANATPSSYKNKKNLKLITPTNNNNLLSINNENETNKNKILTPQPENKVASVSPKHSNPLSCFTYPPSMKLETKNSLDNHDFMYKDEIFEVIMKKFGHKSQEDRVIIHFFLFYFFF